MSDGTDQLDTISTRPKRRVKLVLWLAVLALFGLAAAGGAGYYAWNLRATRAGVLEQLEKLRWESRACAERGDELEAAKSELARELGSCEARRTQEQDTREAAREPTRAESALGATPEEFAELRRQRAEAEERRAAMRELRERLQEMIDAGKLAVTERDGDMHITMPAKLLFESDRVELSRSGQLALMEVALILRAHRDRRLMIIGHTDNQPSDGPHGSAWELSTVQAVKVAGFLVEAGLPAKRILAAGHGPHDPVAGNKDAQGRQENRRIEIVLPGLGAR